MHLKHATFETQEPKRTRPRRSGSRLRKTKKKWIDGSRDSRLQDQEVDRWIKIQESKDPRSNHYTDAQVGDTEGLFKSLDGSRLKKARPKKQSLYRCPGWGHQRSLQVTINHNTTTTGQSFHACVTIIYIKKYTV